MGNERLALPERRGYDQAYEFAYRLACEQLGRINDIERQCERSGTRCELAGSAKQVFIHYLNRLYTITLNNFEISLPDSAENVPIRDKLLIIHYFIFAKGTPPSNRLITFQDLPEGLVYSPTFAQRTVRPLIEHFGREPHRLLAAGESLGGRRADYGDTAVTVTAFSRVPVTIIVWQGDSELPPQGNVVFDANISDYLPTEDITVLCETITWRLIRYLREAQKPAQ